MPICLNTIFKIYRTCFGALLRKSKECCNVTERMPRDCFLSGLAQPRPNFILQRYFGSKLKGAKSCWSKSFGIARTPEFVRNNPPDLKKLHGKYRTNVTQHRNPSMSGTVEFTRNATPEGRTETLASLLDRLGSAATAQGAATTALNSVRLMLDRKQSQNFGLVLRIPYNFCCHNSQTGFV